MNKESEDLKELYSALAKAQQEMESAKLDSKNPFFKSTYADLPSVIKASRPYLAKNGLAIIQRIMTTENGSLYLATRLCHTSGQWIESDMPITPSKNSIQDIGSYITYVKRYAYSAMVGVVGDDDDDDGEKAMNRSAKDKKEPVVPILVNDSQLKVLSSLLNKLDMPKRESFFAHYNIKKVRDLPYLQFEGACKKLNVTLEANYAYN